MLSAIILSAIVGVVLALVIKKLTKKAPSHNPFHNDTRRAPEPLVTDQDARDKVLKQGYTKKKVPEDLDAIVIGRLGILYVNRSTPLN